MAETKHCASYGDPKVLDALESWHKALIDPKADRGLQAELRRCRTPEQVLTTRAFQRLWASLGSPGGAGTPDLDLALRLALACGVLAHAKKSVKSDSGQPGKPVTFATLLAQPKPGQNEPRMSHLRLRRLLSIDGAETDKLMAELIRAVRLAGDQVEIRSLSRGAMRWNDDTRRDWTFAYYGASATTS